MAKRQNQLILVGFGKFNLDEMLKWRGTEQEEELIFAPDRLPPRFRPESACSEEQVLTFIEYVNWTSELLDQVGVEAKL